MTWHGWLQIAIFAALITAAVKPLGAYIAKIADGGLKPPRPVAALERALYTLAGIDRRQEQNWVTYGVALLWFHLFGIILLYLLQRVQNYLPLNPQQLDAVGPDLALGYPQLSAPRFVRPQAFERARLTCAEQTLDRHVTLFYGSYLQRDPLFVDTNLRVLSGRLCPRPDQAFLRRLIDYGIATG